jgi:hypothetical protein
VAIYWPLDKQFYDGVIREFDSATGRHLIEYDDGERQHLSLSGGWLGQAEAALWRCLLWPPAAWSWLGTRGPATVAVPGALR